MQVVISNKSKLSSSPSRITVSTVNNVGRATFGKIAKIGSVSLEQLSNVTAEGRKDGDVLVYQANTNTYNIKTLPNLDGGSF
jgi:hypothetical protein